MHVCMCVRVCVCVCVCVDVRAYTYTYIKRNETKLTTEELSHPRLHYRLLTLCPAPTDPVPRA